MSERQKPSKTVDHSWWRTFVWNTKWLCKNQLLMILSPSNWNMNMIYMSHWNKTDLWRRIIENLQIWTRSYLKLSHPWNLFNLGTLWQFFRGPDIYVNIYILYDDKSLSYLKCKDFRNFWFYRVCLAQPQLASPIEIDLIPSRPLLHLDICL